MKKLKKIIEDVIQSASFCNQQDIDLKDLYNLKFLLFHSKKKILDDYSKLYGIKCKIPFFKEKECMLLMFVNNLSEKRTLYEKVIENIRLIEQKYSILYMNSQTNFEKNYLIILLDIGEN